MKFLGDIDLNNLGELKLSSLENVSGPVSDPKTGRIWLTDDKVYFKPSSSIDYLVPKSELTSVQGTLQNNIDNESNARAVGDSLLTTNLNNEISRAQGAEGTLQGNIDAEASARTSADGTLTTNLNNEISRAQGAEGTLQGNIDAEKTRAEAAELVLTNNLATEVSTRTSEVSRLDGRIDSAAASVTLQQAYDQGDGRILLGDTKTFKVEDDKGVKTGFFEVDPALAKVTIQGDLDVKGNMTIINTETTTAENFAVAQDVNADSVIIKPTVDGYTSNYLIASKKDDTLLFKITNDGATASGLTVNGPTALNGNVIAATNVFFVKNTSNELCFSMDGIRTTFQKELQTTGGLVVRTVDFKCENVNLRVRNALAQDVFLVDASTGNTTLGGTLAIAGISDVKAKFDSLDSTDSAATSDRATIRSEFAAADGVVDARVTSEVNTLNGLISVEVTNRSNADDGIINLINSYRTQQSFGASSDTHTLVTTIPSSVVPTVGVFEGTNIAGGPLSVVIPQDITMNVSGGVWHVTVKFKTSTACTIKAVA